MPFILIYITSPDMRHARTLANHLLEKHLIACANIFPIKSIYRWKERIQDNSEVVLIAKTKSSLWQKVKSEVKRFHPYDTPCIIKIDAEANAEFEKWIRKETKP